MDRLFALLKSSRACRRLIIIALSLVMFVSLYLWAQPLSPQATWQVGAGWARFTPKGTLIYGVDLEVVEGAGMGIDGGRGFGGPVGPIRFRDPVSGEEKLRVLTARDRIAFADVSADERWLAAVDEHGNLKVWELPSGKVMSDLVGRGPVFSSDSRSLAFAAQDRVIVWDVVENSPILEITGADWPDHFSADGDTLVLTRGKDAILWSLSEQKLRRILTSGRIGSTLISPDKRLLITAYYEDIPASMRTRIWEVATGKEYADVSSADFSFPRMRFSADGRLLTIRYAHLEQVWDVSQKPPVLLDTGCECDELESGIAFSADGRWLAAPKDGNIAVCSLAPFAKRRELKTNAVLCSPHLSPNGQILVSHVATDPFDETETFGDWMRRKLSLPAAERQSVVKVFDVETGADLGQFPGSWWADFSPDGKAFFTALATDDPSTLIVQRWPCPPLKSRIPMSITIVTWALLVLAVLIGRSERTRTSAG